MQTIAYLILTAVLVPFELFAGLLLAAIQPWGSGKLRALLHSVVNDDGTPRCAVINDNDFVVCTWRCSSLGFLGSCSVLGALRMGPFGRYCIAYYPSLWLNIFSGTGTVLAVGLECRRLLGLSRNPDFFR